MKIYFESKQGLEACLNEGKEADAEMIVQKAIDKIFNMGIDRETAECICENCIEDTYSY